MTIGALVCHLPSGALFRLSGRVGAWLCGYDVAGAWGCLSGSCLRGR
ncbi:MAG: hypothetical protein BWY25_02193 [Chloroflexi bacterium ADurb.Bin222]|nr:MAG: hypothetical protein BWY25_02193 [Chloroflexi bacterium ADurb.Bin222]